MTPSTGIDPTKIEYAERLIRPSLDWKVDFDNNRVIGVQDNLDALKQGLYLRLSAERYEWLIYTWNYGLERNDLYGRTKKYITPYLQQRITECLTQDDRVKTLSGFNFDINNNSYHVTFTVTSIFDEILEMEVTING